MEHVFHQNRLKKPVKKLTYLSMIIISNCSLLLETTDHLWCTFTATFYNFFAIGDISDLLKWSGREGSKEENEKQEQLEFNGYGYKREKREEVEQESVYTE